MLLNRPGVQKEKEEPEAQLAAEKAGTGTGTTENAQAKKKAEGMMAQPQFVPVPPLVNYVFEYPTDRLSRRILASPLAKKIAKEKNLDLSTVKGSGPNHRILSRDLGKAQTVGTASFGHRQMPDVLPGTYEELPLTPIRKVIGQRLQEAKTYIPHFYITIGVDGGPLREVREQLKMHDVKVSVNDFIVKACAMALKRVPAVNVGFNSVTQSIVQFKTVDIAIAVSMESGLITPIVRHADYKNVGRNLLGSSDFGPKGEGGELEPQEYQGGRSRSQIWECMGFLIFRPS